MKRLSAALSLVLAAAGWARAEDRMLAGAAKVQTTPKVEIFTDANRNGQYDAGEPFNDLNGNGAWDPVWLAGYRGDRWAKGVHDDLSARALALTSGETTVLLVALDAIGYLFDEVGLVKQVVAEELKIPASHVLIASTHGHSGPDFIGLWGPGGKSGKNSEYLQWVRERLVDACREAVRNRRPARLIFGKTRYSNPIEDCRPPKVINDLLLALQAVDDQGRPIATLVNYAMHAEVLNERNRLVTADYPGALRDRLERRYGGVALFFPADIGGMQSPFVLFHSFWSSNRVGEAVAGKVIEALESGEAVAPSAISVRSESLLFPIENPRFLGAIQSGLFGNSDHFVKKEGDKIFLPSDLSVVRIGPAAFVSIPGEAFPEVGDALRAKISADYPFLIGLCNNEIGYIVPNEEWRDGGYEESMSLGRRTAYLLLTSLFRLLD